MAAGVCAGVDWAKDTHDVVVQDADGERLWAATVTHDEAGLTRLCRSLVTLGVERVAIERPDGLLVERLLDAGLTVIAMHPTRSPRPERSSVRPAGSPTGSTRSCCANSRAPITTASGS